MHVTIDGLDNHAAVPGRPFAVYTEGSRVPYRKTDLGDMALFNTALYMHPILLSGLRAIGHEYPQELSKPIEALIKSLK